MSVELALWGYGQQPAGLMMLPRTPAFYTDVALTYVMLRHGRAAQTLTDALLDRFREILPPDQYAISADGLVMTIHTSGTDEVTVGNPALMFATPGSADEKLGRAFRLAEEMCVVDHVGRPGELPGLGLRPLQRGDIGI